MQNPKGKSTEALKSKLKNWIDTSEHFVDNYYAAKWDMCEKQYQGIISIPEGIPEWRSKLFVGLTFGIVNQDVQGSIKSLYAPSDFVAITPARSMIGVDTTLSASVMKKIMYAQERAAGMYREMYDVVMDSVIKSIGIMKVDWMFENKTKQYLDLADGTIQKITEVKKISTPRLTSIAPEDFIISPNAKNLDTAPYAGYRYSEFVTNMKDNAYYNRADEVSKELDLYDKNMDLSNVTVDVYEIWTPGHVYGITANGNIIKDHVTPYKHNMLPFAICVKYPQQRSIYGLSTVEMFSDIQDWTNVLVNETIDNMRLALQKMFLVSGASDIDTNTLRSRPGLILKVRDGGEIKEFPISPVNQDVYRNIQQMESFTNRILGNLDQVDSSSIGTATEAKLIYQRAQGRYEVFANYNRENFFRRIIKLWIELNQQFLVKEDIEGLIPEEDLKKLKYEPSKVDLTADFVFKITGDKGLDDKTMILDKIEILADKLPKLQNLPPNIDVAKLTDRLFMALDLGDDLIIPTETEKPAGKEGKTDKAPKGTNIQDSINAAAQAVKISPEQLITELATKTGTTPEQVLTDIQNAGSFNTYLQAVQQQLDEAGKQLDAETKNM